VTTVQFGMVLVVLLVVTIVVVVVAGAHDAPTHASQQLAVLPTHTVPFFGAAHRAAPCLIAQDVFPCSFVRQQVTNPALPHVDCAAHLTTAPLHAFGNVPAFTATFAWCATHDT